MSAQDLLIAHGEKILVLVAVAACGYGIYNTFTNQDIRPEDISMERINEMVDKVEKERGNQPPPVMKTPPNYLDDMLARYAVDLPSNKYMAWLGAMTDVGPPEVRGAHYYIYEIHPPILSVKDVIGTIELNVELPGSKRTSDPRISDAFQKTWSLEERADNTAKWVGMLIEQRIGNGEFQPLNTKTVKNGVVLFKGEPANTLISVPTTEPWQRYTFRARLFAKVTGLPLDKASSKDNEQSVLVRQGSYEEDVVNWDTVTKSLKDNDKEFIDKFEAGTKTGPFSNLLGPGESIYTSAESDFATVVGTSSIRFVFEKVNVDFENAENNGASILLTKFLRDPKAENTSGAGKWLLKPVQFKVKKEEGIGQPDVKVENVWGQQKDPKAAKLMIPEDLSTNFVLTEVKTKVKRVLYYEITPKSRPNAGKSKDLVLDKKEIETEVAILTNTQTGSTLELPACERVYKPNKPNSYFYPEFPVWPYNEVEEFKKDPAGFKQRELVPPPPIVHKPGEGPLEEMRKKRNDVLLSTDTDYYELADGRIIYWEHNNNRVVVLVKAGSEAAVDAEAAKAAAAKAAADAAAAEAAAAGAEDKKDAKP